MPDPFLPGRPGLYLSMLHYGLTHNRDFAREHYAFFERLAEYSGELRGRRVLDVGCGKSFWLSLLLNSRGADVTGIDTEIVEPGFGFGKYRRIAARNGVERALRTLVWEVVFARPYYKALADVAPFPLRFEGLDFESTMGDRFDIEHDTFDLAVSHEVFEHIKDVASVVEELRRVLRPHGRTYIYIHNFTSLSGGHHIAWKYPDTEPSRIVPPWDHLRKRLYVDIPSWVNGMREHEYRDIFQQYFEIEDWFSIGNEGEALLTPEIEEELAAYSRHELLSKGFVIVGRPRK